MNEPIHLAAEAPASFEVSQSFEAFYYAESRTLFRRLWLVTGNRAEALRYPTGAPRPTLWGNKGRLLGVMW
jgi:hypothetical protein